MLKKWRLYVTSFSQNIKLDKRSATSGQNTDDFKSFHNSPAFLEKGLIPAEEGWDRNVPGEAMVGGGGGQKAVVGRSS